MNFSIFNVSTTNLFPAANTVNGGQLCTEFNLRSRESVDTNPDVKYMIGHSYVHEIHEFDISHDAAKGDAILTIAPGKAVLNGHFFESLAPIDIDIAEGNSNEVSNGGVSVRGRLVVGLRVMYSSNTTMVGETDSEGNYLGVQVIVLPESQFILPGQTTESLTDPDVVTAHLRLGSFIYRNGRIQDSSIENNQEKTKYLDAARIVNLDESITGDYFDKKGLTRNKFYTVAAKFEQTGQGSQVEAEFCDSTDSMMRWDNKPTTFESSPDAALQAELRANPSAVFIAQPNGKGAYLFIPHKQVDNSSTKTVKPTDYKPVKLQLPIASLPAGTAGIVDINYSAGVNKVLNKINEFYNLTNGKQLMFIDILDNREDLPPIPKKANIGDYIAVRQDTTLEEAILDAYSWPGTLYIVLPGIVESYVYAGTGEENQPQGMELATMNSEDLPETEDAEIYGAYWNLEDMQYRGDTSDYFTYYYVEYDDNGKSHETPYYFTVAKAGKWEWSQPFIVTAQIPLAQEELIGGFYNVPDTSDYSDAGYVGLDEYGHLVMRDYGLLRTGTLAYQLGSDFLREGLTLEELQYELDEYVNERVAFPNENSNTSSSNVINVTIDLPETEEGGVVEIRGLDSRFNTSVYLHINGSATENTTVRVIDCEKLRIDNHIAGTPKIELYRCNLYYDAYVINKLSVIDNMKLWYEKFDSNDADIVVDNMTVRELEAAIPVEDVDYWSTESPNDNHYQYALQSLTFDNSGRVVGVGLFIRDCSTRDELPEGRHVTVADFTLPNGSGLIYPPSRFLKKLKVTGTFSSAYVPSNMDKLQIFMGTINFTAVTDIYNPDVSEDIISGKITICDDSYIVESIGGDSALVTGNDVEIPGIHAQEFHIFQGGVIS